MADWYIEKGPESDVVVSSRVRLARNFKEYPFPLKMNVNQQGEVLNRVREAVIGERTEISDKMLFVDMQTLTPIDRQALVEKHLISPNLAISEGHVGALISKDSKISIMVNEEDHLRIQCLFPGMQLKGAWELCNKIDTILESKIEYAFNSRLGYLTCCPTNLGTGIRGSAMLHLPALVMTGYIKGMLEICGKLGMTVRGIYGENTEASGNLFQISNQVTLGQTEEEIINNINNIVSQIMDQERTLRSEIYKQDRIRFEDKIFRSLGVFSNARIISSEESFKLISDVRLGIDMGIINNIEIETLNELTLLIQSANLQKMAGTPMASEERDVMRAELIRKKLNKAI